MKKNKLMFLDVETIPSGEPIDPLTLTPPATMSKPETIAAWYKDKAVDIAGDKYRSRALDSMEGEILCIGYSVDDGLLHTVVGETEYDTLLAFQGIILEFMGQYREPITFVGWNITSFDIPFLWRKAIKYGLKDLRNAFNRDRYKGNHLDLMTVWATDYRDYRKLDDVAKFLGIAGKIEGVDGSNIYDIYLDGDLNKIYTYCLNDVRIVKEIYHKIYG
jgi:uncharacterized protein YprB with RNaseH-like and TPR domain